MITVKQFGVTPAGEPVQQVIITNAAGHELGLISYGASWQFFREHEGTQYRDLVIGFDNLADYIEHPYYLGNAIGRVGGRIGSASFDLNGEHVEIEANENNNTLHGGSHGFADRNWHTQVLEAENAVVFSTAIASSEDHFPGNLTTTVKYTLTDDNVVEIEFTGLSDADTLYNPTSHVYMNPAGKGTDARELYLELAATKRLAMDGELIPTGEKLDVIDTPYDFTKATKIATNLDKGIDHFDDVFETITTEGTANAILSDPKSGRAIEVRTDRNGLVFFITNPVREDTDSAKWVEQHPFNAVALEAQTLSDAIHYPALGNIILPANHKQTYKTSYSFKGLK
ncbi:possible aldose 1-epimerase [Weissella oryzae SG25]|uniref:Possible aldose 1-epimerase n=1 Tax=Weissella oryzae (strain DSM 25784 / JCM 18191 / LMG 30913 / SG25) TaxID=1329250 RepID=A0A069CRR0_WEIOS|nr:aldose epimerase family protein [Weissella oryzae]GAK30062.1 possible aldose 1-epimerase [Weissella oryzae SG25]